MVKRAMKRSIPSHNSGARTYTLAVRAVVLLNSLLRLCKLATNVEKIECCKVQLAPRAAEIDNAEA